jgi:hypothetical protein
LLAGSELVLVVEPASACRLDPELTLDPELVRLAKGFPYGSDDSDASGSSPDGSELEARYWFQPDTWRGSEPDSDVLLEELDDSELRRVGLEQGRHIWDAIR